MTSSAKDHRPLLATATVLLIAVAIGFAINSRQTILFELRDRLTPPPTMPIQTIMEPEELANALQHDAVILHLDVDWAVQAAQSRPVVARFQASIESDPAYQHVAFRRIDCTEQSGPLWNALSNWLRDQQADRSLMSTGCGAVVWVRAGKVVAFDHCAALEGHRQLLATTAKALGTER